MKKGYVYFFKHVGLSPVKVGMTTSETVTNRFESFKTYAPYGAEILGYIETENPLKLEQLIHNQFKEKRLQGEFFEISTDIVNSLILKHSSSKVNKIKHAFNVWLSTTDIEKCDLDSLVSLLESKSEIKNSKKISENQLLNLINENFELYPPFDVVNFITTTKIREIITEVSGNQFGTKQIGLMLKKIGVDRVKYKGVYGYLLLKKSLPIYSIETQ